MKVDSLEELTAAFDEWRGKKKHPREAIPQELVERARRTARVHGARCVTQAMKLDSRRLRGLKAARGASKPGRVERGAHVPVPGYSRGELAGTVGVGRPLAELEMASGVKARVYAATEEMMSLVSQVCAGGGR